MMDEKLFLKEHSGLKGKICRDRYEGEDCSVSLSNIHETQIDKQKVKEAVNSGFGLNANCLRKHILEQLNIK